jgi:hypothetical protein
MTGLEPKLLYAAAQFVGHFFRAAGGRHGHGQKKSLHDL